MLIKLFASLRLPETGRFVEVPWHPGETVRTALESLFARHPALREMIMAPGGQELLPFVNVMVSGRLVRDLQGLDTPVQEGDSLAIFPPSAGG